MAAPADEGVRVIRIDPNRRERIARAAAQIIGERGLEKLTHRAVAELADVPLGSTTYHFKSKDDLMQVALETAVADYRRYLDQVLGGRLTNPSLQELFEATAHDLADAYTVNRTTISMHLELMAAAIHRPALRPLAEEFHTITRDFYCRYLDPERAGLLTDTGQGIILRVISSPHPPDREQIKNRLMLSLGEPPA